MYDNIARPRFRGKYRSVTGGIESFLGFALAFIITFFAFILTKNPEIYFPTAMISVLFAILFHWFLVSTDIQGYMDHKVHAARRFKWNNIEILPSGDPNGEGSFITFQRRDNSGFLRLERKNGIWRPAHRTNGSYDYLDNRFASSHCIYIERFFRGKTGIPLGRYENVSRKTLRRFYLYGGFRNNLDTDYIWYSGD